MGFISVLNEMRLEQQSQNLITFGTCKGERIVGVLITLMGLGMLCFIYVSKVTMELAIYTILGLFVACLFCCIGLFLLTTQQYVIVDKTTKRVEVEKSSLFLGKHEKAIHFNEIAKLEITKNSHMFLFSQCCKWLVKAYIRRSDKPFVSECIFFSSSYNEAQKVAQLIAVTCDCEIYDGSIASNDTAVYNNFKYKVA